MPAVNPSRLNFQIADLLQSFHKPDAFLKKVKALFSLYANRTLRDGEMTDQTLLMLSYRLPDPVMRQLKSELKPAAFEDPESALTLADTLWQDDFFEVRQVAVFLLGHAGVDNPEPILSRLRSWLMPGLEPALKESLLNTGSQRLQSKFPTQWEAWIESLLSRKTASWTALGLAGLKASLSWPKPQNLPIIFRMVSPFILEPQAEIMNELKHLVIALAAHSPTETAYFLKQTLSLSSSPRTVRLVRQCLPAFPDEVQDGLKSAIKSQ